MNRLSSASFKLPSNDISYYRDLALMWPVLLFSLAAIFNIASPASPVDRIYGFRYAVLAIVALLLAKERLILIRRGKVQQPYDWLIALLMKNGENRLNSTARLVHGCHTRHSNAMALPPPAAELQIALENRYS